MHQTLLHHESNTVNQLSSASNSHLTTMPTENHDNILFQNKQAHSRFKLIDLATIRNNNNTTNTDQQLYVLREESFIPASSSTAANSNNSSSKDHHNHHHHHHNQPQQQKHHHHHHHHQSHHHHQTGIMGNANYLKSHVRFDDNQDDVMTATATAVDNDDDSVSYSSDDTLDLVGEARSYVNMDDEQNETMRVYFGEARYHSEGENHADTAMRSRESTKREMEYLGQFDEGLNSF